MNDIIIGFILGVALGLAGGFFYFKEIKGLGKKFCPTCKINEPLFGIFCSQCGGRLKEKYIAERVVK